MTTKNRTIAAFLLFTLLLSACQSALQASSTATLAPTISEDFGEVLEADKESFQKRFAELDLEQGVILFKGSRLNKLEQLVEIFKQNNADKKDR